MAMMAMGLDGEFFRVSMDFTKASEGFQHRFVVSLMVSDG
jgi:hypothetical protein